MANIRIDQDLNILGLGTTLRLYNREMLAITEHLNYYPTTKPYIIKLNAIEACFISLNCNIMCQYICISISMMKVYR